RPVGPEDGQDLTGPDADGHVEREAPGAHVHVGSQGHGRTSQRSRRPTSTANDTARSTRLRATAASRSLSSRRYTARGRVWVRPTMLPAKVMVAPNSPRARAQASTAPAAIDGPTMGSVTRRKMVSRE